MQYDWHHFCLTSLTCGMNAFDMIEVELVTPIGGSFLKTDEARSVSSQIVFADPHEGVQKVPHCQNGRLCCLI